MPGRGTHREAIIKIAPVQRTPCFPGRSRTNWGVLLACSMATAKQLRGMSEVLTKHEQDLRENAERAQERSAKLSERADRAKLSSNANTAHAKAARDRQDER